MYQVLWRIPLKTAWLPDGIPIYGFGLMLFLAFILCTWLAGRRAQNAGIAREHIQDLAIWLFIGGLIGARITFLIEEDPSPDFMAFLWKLPRIWDGGIILYGSILGGIAGYIGAYYFIFRRHGISTLKLADIIAPAIAVGLCLGRFGCFLNGCCYGQVACPDCPVYAVHFPWTAPAGEALVDGGFQTIGFTIRDEPGGKGVKVDRVVPGSEAEKCGLQAGDLIVQAGDREVSHATDLTNYLRYIRYSPNNRGATELTFHVDRGESNFEPRSFTPHTLGLYPTQLFESISMLLLFMLLTAYFPFRTRDGQVMVLLMLCYAVHRYLNEMLRDDPRPIGFERYASVILFAAGVVLGLWLLTRPAQYRTQMQPAG
jgi:prolipoprotein diacylglyceryltransferase